MTATSKPMNVLKKEIVTFEDLRIKNNMRPWKHESLMEEINNLPDDKWLLLTLDRPVNSLNGFLNRKGKVAFKINTIKQNHEGTVWAVRKFRHG